MSFIRELYKARQETALLGDILGNTRRVEQQGTGVVIDGANAGKRFRTATANEELGAERAEDNLEAYQRRTGRIPPAQDTRQFAQAQTNTPGFNPYAQVAPQPVPAAATVSPAGRAPSTTKEDDLVKQMVESLGTLQLSISRPDSLKTEAENFNRRFSNGITTTFPPNHTLEFQVPKADGTNVTQKITLSGAYTAKDLIAEIARQTGMSAEVTAAIGATAAKPAPAVTANPPAPAAPAAAPAPAPAPTAAPAPAPAPEPKPAPAPVTPTTPKVDAPAANEGVKSVHGFADGNYGATPKWHAGKKQADGSRATFDHNEAPTSLSDKQVQQLQRLLKVQDDGLYGPETHNALKLACAKVGVELKKVDFKKPENPEFVKLIESLDKNLVETKKVQGTQQHSAGQDQTPTAQTAAPAKTALGEREMTTGYKNPDGTITAEPKNPRGYVRDVPVRTLVSGDNLVQANQIPAPQQPTSLDAALGRPTPQHSTPAGAQDTANRLQDYLTTQGASHEVARGAADRMRNVSAEDWARAQQQAGSLMDHTTNKALAGLSPEHRAQATEGMEQIRRAADPRTAAPVAGTGMQLFANASLGNGYAVLGESGKAVENLAAMKQNNLQTQEASYAFVPSPGNLPARPVALTAAKSGGRE